VLGLIALGALWIELTRAQTLREFPSASATDLFAEVRTRVTSWWEEARERSRVRPARAAPAAGDDLTTRLASLADLHASGALTDEEFDSAKARVLAGE
jgi:hypothetical protein